MTVTWPWVTRLTLCACTTGLWYLVCVCISVTRNSFRSLIQTRAYCKVIYHIFFDFNSRILLKWFCSRDMAFLLTLARLDIFQWQNTQQMFLTSSPASVLSDDIRKMGSVSQKKKKKKTLSSLWLFSIYTVSVVNARALIGCARDNHRPWHAHSIIVCNCSDNTISFYGTEGLHFSALFLEVGKTMLSSTPFVGCLLVRHSLKLSHTPCLWQILDPPQIGTLVQQCSWLSDL